MKTQTYVKQEGRWYPVIDDGNTIDMRGPGYKTKAEVKRVVRERAEYTEKPAPKVLFK